MEGLSGSVERLNLGDAPEAGALAAAVASAAVGATSSPASASGFSKAVDDSSSSNHGGSQTPGAGPAAHDKDNDVEGKLFIGGISWQTTEEGLRSEIVRVSLFLSRKKHMTPAICLSFCPCAVRLSGPRATTMTCLWRKLLRQESCLFLHVWGVFVCCCICIFFVRLSSSLLPAQFFCTVFMFDLKRNS